MNAPDRRNVTIILVEADTSGSGAEIDLLLAEVNAELAKAAGVEAAAKADAEPDGSAAALHVPEDDARRDVAFEDSVVESIERPLTEMVQRHAERVLSMKDAAAVISTAVQEEIVQWIAEIERDGAAALRSVISDLAEGWRKYCPSREDVVKDVIKYAIRGTIVAVGATIVRAASIL